LDALRRSHQCATIQLDFQLPIRFNLGYVRYVWLYDWAFCFFFNQFWMIVFFVLSPPRSRVHYRPKPSDFSGWKNPQHAFLQRGSKIICPMSQLWGMRKNPPLFVNSEIAGQIPLVPSFASRLRYVSGWYTAPLVVKEGSS
jgi:hypothetical protein